MRLSGLSLAVALLISSVALAQHPSGGGGSSGGGASSGGGSHGGSTGGSSSSGGSHSSGGSASHASGTHSSNSGSSAAWHGSKSQVLHSGSEARGGAHMKTAQPQKRSFFSFLAHPFKKPQPKRVNDLRRWPCLKGPCPVCPAGSAHRGGCGVVTYNNVCTQRELWSGGSCLLQTRFLDACIGQRMAMEQQARRMQDAEADRDRACGAGSTQECSGLSSTAQSESIFYQTLLERYRQCQTRWPSSSFGADATFASFPSWQFDRLGAEN